MADVFDIVKNEVLSYRTLLRAVSFMGWPVMLASYLPGVIGIGAEVAIHAAPGMAMGESFTDAFVSEYGWRLKLAATYLTGFYVAQATAAAAGAIGGLGGLGISDAAERGVKELIDKAKRELGEKAVAELQKKAEEIADREINQAFQRVVSNPQVAEAVKRASEPELRNIRRLQEMAKAEGVREDVAAMAISALRHTRLFEMTPDKFSVATGKYIGPILGQVQDDDVLVPIVVEDSGAFSETPHQVQAREALERAIARAEDRRATHKGILEAGIVLAPLAVVYFAMRARR